MYQPPMCYTARTRGGKGGLIVKYKTDANICRCPSQTYFCVFPNTTFYHYTRHLGSSLLLCNHIVFLNIRVAKFFHRKFMVDFHFRGQPGSSLVPRPPGHETSPEHTCKVWERACDPSVVWDGIS